MSGAGDINGGAVRAFMSAGERSFSGEGSFTRAGGKGARWRFTRVKVW